MYHMQIGYDKAFASALRSETSVSRKLRRRDSSSFMVQGLLGSIGVIEAYGFALGFWMSVFAAVSVFVGCCCTSYADHQSLASRASRGQPTYPK